MSDAGAELQLVTSTANPIVKLARQLATRRRARARERLFLIEGIRAIESARHHGITIQTLLIDDERRGEVPPALFASIGEQPRLMGLSRSLFSSISDAEHPQPIIAIAAIPATTLPAEATCIVALDAVRDPGNLGTIIRTAAAAGVEGIALLPGCVDPYNPKSVRSSAGMVAALPIEPVRSVQEVIERCFASSSQVAVVAADARGTRDYRDVDWKKPVVIVVGNEAHGLNAGTLPDNNELVQIPIEPGVESLNVSIATGVLLFEMRSRRSSERD